MSEKKVTLSVQDYHYTCGDGCCDDYGERVFVNGEQINADIYMNAHDAIEQILKHLGYEVEWKEMDYDRIDNRVRFED